VAAAKTQSLIIATGIASIYHREPGVTMAAQKTLPLGPKMSELSRDTCTGAHPYFTSPDHTAMARKILGSTPWLCVEQKVILETDPTKARSRARRPRFISVCRTIATTGCARE
jgi:hypothetical protein